MEEALHEAVERMLSLGAEFCDARYQTVHRLNIMMVDAGVRSLTEETTGGVCLRARIAGSWGYVSTVSVDKDGMLEGAMKAVKNARHGTSKGKRIPELKPIRGTYKAQLKINPEDVPLEEKLELVKDLDKAQKTSEKIVNTNAFYNETIKRSWLVNSFSTSLAWEEARGRAIAQPIASDGSKVEVFYHITDGTGGFEKFKSLDVSKIGRTCANEAIQLLSAKKCPSGYHTCISDPTISGLLAHEVMGHASEADEIVKRRSFLTGAVGQKVASEQITMVDDGTVEGAYGRIPFDDEGVPASRTVIIDKGVYRGVVSQVRPHGNRESGLSARGVACNIHAP